MKIKKSLALILASLMMVSSFASCSKKETGANKGSVDVSKYAGMDYDEASEAIYNDVLGNFYEAYQIAKDETSNVSKRYALMAIAEAKLLESAVMLPGTSKGGNYAISRVAPYTIDYTLWGTDNDRFHQALVATEIIKVADRDEMKAKWGELKGTGTYLDWAKSFLTEKGYTIKDSYSLGYTSDPQTWDVLATSRSADSEAIVNTYDGLLEYDVEGTLQPALATALGEFSEPDADGHVTVTYKLREGVKWVDSQGREVGDLTADDFVAGLQHMLEAGGGLESLIYGIILNAKEYVDGTVTDFSQVGVKAVDNYTLQYTLEKQCSYFETMIGYNMFCPMNRAFYESKGGKFGAEFDPSAESYVYGTTPDNIAYCGPYLVTNATAENTIIFSANPSYWNKDNINIKTITWLFNDGTDALKAYNDAKAGVLDGAGLNASALIVCKEDGLFDDYAYVSGTDATSYMSFYNLNRAAYANINDETEAVSTLTDEQKTVEHAAMGNVHFRRALSFALDRGAWNAATVGEDLKYASIRNTYTPATFVSLTEDTTVDINGKATTFKAGTHYGAVMQAQLDADGVAIKAYDPNGDSGIGSGDYYDGWFNKEEAVKEMNLAVEDLKAMGITVDAEHPVYIDLPYASNLEAYTNRANVYKQCIETNLEGKVIVNLVACTSTKAWYYSGYYTDFGYEYNCDVCDVSGWGPDYGDPSSYLDTFLPNYDGYMVKALGIY